jgi:hypothetical protein
MVYSELTEGMGKAARPDDKKLKGRRNLSNYFNKINYATRKFLFRDGRLPI